MLDYLFKRYMVSRIEILKIENFEMNLNFENFELRFLNLDFENKNLNFINLIFGNL